VPKAPTSGEGAILAMRKEHPKAYARWTDEEERELVAAFNDGQKPKVIAERMGRKRGGIVSRLKKLGLIEE
jgi:hypothetical protein